MREILELDREYRQRAAKGDLPEISPRRFNPTGDVRLPILHADRGPWHFTALYSNTPNAHRYGRTRDWVVIYYARPGEDEAQCTIVTEQTGPMAGRRVVRGFEAASAAIQADRTATPADQSPPEAPVPH